MLHYLYENTVIMALEKHLSKLISKIGNRLDTYPMYFVIKKFYLEFHIRHFLKKI